MNPSAATPAETLGFWRIATKDPDRPAIVDADGQQLTFGELLAMARGIGNTLTSLGLEAGDHYAMAMPNHHAFFAVLLAGMERGLIITPVNSHLAASEVAHVLADSGAKVFVAHASIVEVARAAAKDADLPADRCFAVGEIDGFRPFTDLVSADQTPPSTRSPGGLMMYTSGTTGKPKGVQRPLAEGDPDDLFGTVAAVTCQGFGVPVRSHRHLVCGPLYHAGPFVGATNALHVGGTLVLIERWSPEECLHLLELHHVESTQMVPTMFHRLLSLPEEVRAKADLSELKSVFHTGAPCPERIKARMMEWWGPVVYETYGGTESAATIATPKRWLQKPGTVGKAIRGTTVRILDEDGEELPAGEIGEIWIESAAGPSEYHNDPAKSAAMRRGRMVTLGDVGFLDEDGFLFLRDRKIDMIISGGVNIYPAEVEAALLEDDAIADATVIGIPDEEWGEQVKAIVELRSGHEASDATAEAIIERCRDRIARFKCPRSIDFVDALPRLPNGKIEKRRLREPYWAGQGSAI